MARQQLGQGKGIDHKSAKEMILNKINQ
jgi:hypothetical protein